MSLSSSKKIIILLFLIPATLTIIWFRNGLIHGGGEEGILYYNPQKILSLSATVWSEFGTGLFVASWLQRAPVMYLSSVFQQIGIPPVLFQATLIYILMVTGILSVFYLTLNFLSEHEEKFLISLAAALFYLFNPFSFSQVWGRGLSAQYYAFALLPLTLLLFYFGINKKKYIFGLLSALISTLMATAYEWPTFTVVYHLIILTYFAFHIITSKEKLKEILFGLKFIIAAFFIWGLFNFWWLMPLFSSVGSIYAANLSGLTENLGTLLGVSRNFTPDILIRLLQRTYFYDASAFSTIFTSLPFHLISWLPVIFLLFGFIKIFKDKLSKFKFFVVLLSLGLIVSLGANPPFGPVFVWLFKSFTFLQAFRNPFEKFGLVLILGYSPIFAYGLVSFFAGKKYKNLAVTSVLLLICVIFAWPMWTGRVIAGPDKKIGLDIPVYYKDLRNFLNNKGEDFRLLMTPIWSGDGAFYQWGNGGRYQGSDPMFLMLDQSVISNGARGPYWYDFVTNIRKYMERINVAPSLALLRINFLIDRKDAIMVTDKEKDHYKYLTSVIFPPQQSQSNLKSICPNISVDNQASGVAWIACQVSPGDNNFSSIKYLHIKVKTDVSANLEVAIRDIKGVRIRWYVRETDTEYQAENNWTIVTIPLSAPTEANNEIDFSKVLMIEVLAHPKEAPEKSVGKIDMAEIKLDPGLERKTEEFKKVADFGKLSVFEARQFNAPPEIGSLSSILKVADFVSLFEEVNEKRDKISKTAFVLMPQNTDKNLELLPKNTQIQVIDKSKISNTRYWVKINEAQEDGLLVLSKTFNPQWQVIPGITKEKLSGNLFDDLKLLQMPQLSEDDHFVVNGYANLWKIDGKDSQYAILFRPQIIAGISAKISIFSIVSVVGLSIIKWVMKKIAGRRLNGLL